MFVQLRRVLLPSVTRRLLRYTGIVEYPKIMTKPRTMIKRPGAGVDIDRERLVRLREIRLLSRAQLAAKMSDDEFSITPDAIAKIENGYRRPKTTTLSRLCEALGCDPEDLLPDRPAAVTPVRVPCPECKGLYGHEPGCPHAT